MNYQLIVLRAGLFLIFGLSLAIILYGVGFLKEKNKKRLFANCFVCPAVCVCLGFSYGGESLARGSIGFGFLALFLGMFLVEKFQWKARNYRLIDTIIGVIAFGAVWISIQVSTIVWAPYIYVGVNTISVILGGWLALRHRKDKGNEIAFLRGLVLLLLGMGADFFSGSVYGLFIAMFLLSVALYNMYGYFHEGNYKNLTAKIDEAEKLKASVEKDLNYEVKKRMFEIERSNERLLEISKTDALTKAYNKSAILNIIEKQCSFKNAKTFSILMFDIDYFKQINDKLGHITGDLCLKTLANIAFGNIRSIDYFGRYGGDEFIIVLPTLGLNEAKQVAERFRARIAETENPTFTVSIGVACYPEDGSTYKELLAAADEGLYRSKAKGRNAVSHKSMF